MCDLVRIQDILCVKLTEEQVKLIQRAFDLEIRPLEPSPSLEVIVRLDKMMEAFCASLNVPRLVFGNREIEQSGVDQPFVVDG